MNSALYQFPALAQFARGRDKKKRRSRGRTVVRVGNGDNQARMVVGDRRLTAAIRGRVPVPEGELVGKLVSRVNRDGRNIKEEFQVAPRRGGIVVRGQGNLGGLQLRGGGFLGYQPSGYQRDVALMNQFSSLAEFRRGRDKKKRKPKTVSLVARLTGKNRAKYTDINRNMKLAQKIYKQGEPGLLEKWGIIPNRRG